MAAVLTPALITRRNFKMPFKSESQRRFFYAANKRGDISDADLKKWEDETPKDKKLPDRLEKKAFMEGFEKEAFNVKVDTIKKLPIYGALGMGALGGLSGYAGSSSSKTAYRKKYNKWKKNYLSANPGSSKDSINSAWKKRRTLEGLGVGALGGLLLGSHGKATILGVHKRQGDYYRNYKRYSSSGSAKGPSAGKGLDQLKGMLGVGGAKTKQEVKKGFRAKAMKHHPDRGGNPSTMKAINDAYSEIKKSSWFNKLSQPFWLGFSKQASGTAHGGGKGFTGVGTGSNANPIGELKIDDQEGLQQSHGRAGGEDTRTEKELLDRERNPRDYAHGESGERMVTPDGRTEY